MNRADFISFLEGTGCVIVRTDKKGYSVCRNVVSGAISGIPFNDPLMHATVCRICKTLLIDPPEQCKVAQEIVEIAHKKHSNGE